MTQQLLWSRRGGNGPIAAPIDAALELGAYERL